MEDNVEEARNQALEDHLDAVQTDDVADTDQLSKVVEDPIEPEHGNYDVKAQSATEEAADYTAEETNPKEVTDE